MRVLEGVLVLVAAVAAQSPSYEGTLPDGRDFVVVFSQRPFLAIPRQLGGHYPILVDELSRDVVGFDVPELDASFVGEPSGERLVGFLERGGKESALTLRAIDDGALEQRIGSLRASRRDFGPELRRLLERAEAFGFSGQLVVVRDGSTVFDGCYGLADDASGAPVRAETMFGVASISKTVTAAAVAKLVELGKLAWNARLDRFFPDVPAAVAGVTVEQLLTHTAGLGVPDRAVGIPQRLRDEAERRAWFRAGLALPRDRVGEWVYNNFGYQLAAEIVERAAGRGYADFVRSELFGPAGMATSGFYGDRWPDLAHQYWNSDQGTAVDWPGHHLSVRGNGDVVSTARELASWASALVRGEVLEPETLAQLWHPRVSLRDRRVGPGLHYGLGWFVHRTLRGTRLLEHGGDFALGFNGWLGVWRDEQLVLALTCNRRDHRGNWLRAAVEGSIQRLLFGRPYDMPPAGRTRRDGEGRELIGTWRSAGATLAVDEHAGRLRLSAGDQAGIDALHRSLGGDSTELAFAMKHAPALARRYRAQIEAIAADDADSSPLDLAIFRRGWRARLVGRYGAYRGCEVIGTAPAGGGRLQTWVTVRFERRSTLIRFDEQGGRFVFWDYDAAPPFALPLAPAADGSHWLGHDLFAGDTLRLNLDGASLGIAGAYGSTAWTRT